MIENYKQYEPLIDPTCFIAPGSSVIGRVRIGKNSSVWYNAVLRGDIDEIVIGENTNIQDGCILHCVTNIPTIVGNSVTVGHGAILHSCSIGDNSLIGMGSILLDGVRIGEQCLVAAGTIITPGTRIPDKSLVMGTPGTVKRQLSDREVERFKKGALVYMDLIADYKSTDK